MEGTVHGEMVKCDVMRGEVIVQVTPNNNFDETPKC